jgi:hypothetical protein
MRTLLVILALAAPSLAADQPTCLIVKHASAARQIFVSGANWMYVAGDFPKGMKWKSNITDRYIRKVKERGGRVATVSQEYTAADLKQAFETCKVESEQTVK